MKRLILVTSLAVLFTGCAQVNKVIERRFADPIELAKEDCDKMGFNPNTDQYRSCVLSTTQHIRNIRIQQSNDSEAAMQGAMNARPKTISCRQVGSSMMCNEF